MLVFDERRQDWPVQIFGLWRLERLHATYAEWVSFSPPRTRRILVIYRNLFLHSSEKARFIFYRRTTTSTVSVIHKCLMTYSHQRLNFCNERCKCRFTFVCSVIILVFLCRKGAIFIILVLFWYNRPFWRCLKPPFQSEAKCEAIDLLK